ncbi:hypothetical protein MTR67_007938 [Solanum verrucosum]|uniref:F-box domain-containing protein n=1 Tax=Solanum verrucosum TaxID=315347 RepID=A0AAF0Q160_SOLVR|nr:hypothetical protein MTR67_007938 [Solanum verrucosum]
MMDRSPRNCAKTDKIEVETGTDWISALPNSLIVEILCKIPITDACTTTILSKRWQNMWTCIHDLNCYRSKTSTGWSAKRFISFIDNALPRLTSSKIEGFTLHFRSNIALSNYSSKLNKWLQIVLKKKVENLHLDLRLGDLSSLIHADLTYHWYDLHGLDDVINKSIVKDHLTSVACANDLIISSLYIEMISMLILQKEDVPLPLLECKRLTINSWTSKYTFFGIDRLLSSTPCLENLTIHLKKDSTFLNYWCEDMDMLEDIFEGSLRNLKILKVILQWSLFINHMTTEQTKVMKYLLERAKNLEKLVIVPTNSGCSKMIKSLLALPIVSNTTLLVSVEPLADVEYE